MIKINNAKNIDDFSLSAIGPHNYTTKINDITYYLKDWNFVSINDLIASEIFKLMDIPCISYEVAKKGNNYYLMSKSFIEPGYNYYSGEDLLDFYLGSEKANEIFDNESFSRWRKRNNLETIWDMLENRYPINDPRHKDIRSIMIDLIKQYVMSIILVDSDFNSSNWIIRESENDLKLMPKFDNGGAFSSDIFGMSFGINEDDFGSIGDSITTYLNFSSDVDQSIFWDIYNKISLDIINQAIANVQERFLIIDFEHEDERIIHKYIIFRNSLATLMEERGQRR